MIIVLTWTDGSRRRGASIPPWQTPFCSSSRTTRSSLSALHLRHVDAANGPSTSVTCRSHACGDGRERQEGHQQARSGQGESQGQVDQRDRRHGGEEG